MLDGVLWCVRGLNLSPTASGGRNEGQLKKLRHGRCASEHLHILSCCASTDITNREPFLYTIAIKSPASLYVSCPSLSCTSSHSVYYSEYLAPIDVFIDRTVTPRKVARTPACSALRWMLKGNQYILPICSL